MTADEYDLYTPQSAKAVSTDIFRITKKSIGDTNLLQVIEIDLPRSVKNCGTTPSTNLLSQISMESPTKNATIYCYETLLHEDQGIDLTQLSGRGSPGSLSESAGSCSRHSTASLDSGHASSYVIGGGESIQTMLPSPTYSLSSCSIGSIDRTSQPNEQNAIFDWLVSHKCEEFAHLFYLAGYDMATIARMTPEDLTAIGVRNPKHRERLKHVIDKLQLPDGLPSFVPGSIEEWLKLLRLEQYIQPLLDQNYKTVVDVTLLTWEDLEDIGIIKLGHQKKMLLAIKRVKDIINDKWRNTSWITEIKQQSRVKSLESFEDISELCIGTQLTNINNNGMYRDENMARRKSYGHDDTTPTNDLSNFNNCNNPEGMREVLKPINIINCIKPPFSNVQNYSLGSAKYNVTEDAHLSSNKLHHHGSVHNTVLCKKRQPDPLQDQASLGITGLLNEESIFYEDILKHLEHSDVVKHKEPFQRSSNFSTAHTQQTNPEIHCDLTREMQSNSQTMTERPSSRRQIEVLYPQSKAPNSSITKLVTGELRSCFKPSSLLNGSSLPSSTKLPPVVCFCCTREEGNAGSLSQSGIPSDPVTTNILSDIGHMLSNLTHELDKMLDEEKRIRINDVGGTVEVEI